MIVRSSHWLGERAQPSVEIFVVYDFDVAVQVFRVRLEHFPFALCRLDLLDHCQAVEAHGARLLVFAHFGDLLLLNLLLGLFVLRGLLEHRVLELCHCIEKLDDSLGRDNC